MSDYPRDEQDAVELSERHRIDRDLSPIDQQWMQRYCDEFLKVSVSIPEGPFRDAILRRIECVMDIVEAWQKRNLPMEKQ